MGIREDRGLNAVFNQPNLRHEGFSLTIGKRILKFFGRIPFLNPSNICAIEVRVILHNENHERLIMTYNIRKMDERSRARCWEKNAELNRKVQATITNYRSRDWLLCSISFQPINGT